MLILFRNAEVYDPEPRGRTSVLLSHGRIAKVGEVDPRAVEALGVEHEIVDLDGRMLIPGLIDPHQHLLGGSGESGFSSQTPEFFVSEIVSHGITTVVGVLGVDTTMKTMAGLLAKVKALREDGLSAYLWTGGYNVPPVSIMASVRHDILYIEEVIGAGEIAISDLRALDPHPADLARIAIDCYVGGMLARKAGKTHFHVGDQQGGLQPLRELLEKFDVQADWLYVTHVERSPELMREAIELARKGTLVDIDVVEEDLARWLRFYRDHGGPMDRLTASSDAGISSPRQLFEQVIGCVREHGFALEEVLPIVTRNTACCLKLGTKGEIADGMEADLVVLERDSLEIVHVIAKGEWMVRDGRLVVRERFLKESKREIHFVGDERASDA